MDQIKRKDFGRGTYITNGSYLSESDDDEPHKMPKKPKLECGVKNETKYEQFVLEAESNSSSQKMIFSEVSKNLMKKMGYQSGKGIGKMEQGRLEPVEASKQRGRRGLGLGKQGEVGGPSNVNWDFEKEQMELKECEQLVWFVNARSCSPDLKEEMRCWTREGPLKLTIDDETTFCDPVILRNILDSKSVFDTLDGEDMRRARTRSNPFETIKSAFFQNRAAMKMANMDSVFSHMFTSPRKEFDDPSESLVRNDEIFSFADICAGPGGFSEYVLWKKRGQCTGFGFTLRGENDFRLHDFNAGPPELFHPYYGTKGDGDIFDDENQQSFCQFVMSRTGGRGVHLVMADGGFSVEGQENIQEILSQRLYLCQFLVALLILREGGNFVCKLFDLFTPFSVSLVYLMTFCFERVAIFKPVTSRPANSERYIVCQGRRADCSAVADHLRSVNLRMDWIYPGRKDSDRMVVEVVPLDVLLMDESFFVYVKSSNERLGSLQCMSLLKLKTFMQNTELSDPNQHDTRRRCLSSWEVPDLQKKDLFRKEQPSDRFNRLIQPPFPCCLPAQLDDGNLQHLIKVKRDYRALPISGKERHFLVGAGKSQAHRIPVDRVKDGRWEACEKVALPRDTILDVEFVEEQRGEEGKRRRRVGSIHVNDVLVWHGVDLSSRSFDSRRGLVTLLLAATAKEDRHDLLRYHVKGAVPLERIEEEFFSRIQLGVARGLGCVKSKLLPISEPDRRFVVPIGVLLVRVVADPWMTAWSRNHRKEYYFHVRDNISTFELPPDAVATYSQCLASSLLWCFGPEASQEALVRFVS